MKGGSSKTKNIFKPIALLINLPFSNPSLSHSLYSSANLFNIFQNMSYRISELHTKKEQYPSAENATFSLRKTPT
jgi:hypothetical protein